MKKKITKQRVDETPPAEKPVFIFDTELAGFVLKITPAGRKTYQFRYRMGGRNTPLKTYTIGKHGSPSSEAPRKNRRDRASAAGTKIASRASI